MAVTLLLCAAVDAVWPVKSDSWLDAVARKRERPSGGEKDGLAVLQ